MPRGAGGRRLDGVEEGKRTATRAALPEPDAANGGGKPEGNWDGCVGGGGWRRWAEEID